LSKEKRLYFNKLVTKFKKTNASHESVEAIYDFVYELERITIDLSEKTLLVEAYSLLGFHNKAYAIFSAFDTRMLSAKALKKYHQQLQKFEKNTRLQTRFYYRDLRTARLVKTAPNLTEADFLMHTKKENIQIQIDPKIENLVVFNKYVPLAYSSITVDTLNLPQIITYLDWLSDCKNELLDFYNQHEIPDKVAHANQEWFDGLDVWEVDIELRNDTLHGSIFITDYVNHNLGFCLTTEHMNIISIEYDGNL
jgi:hypothetical protein